eukprot:241954_1
MEICKLDDDYLSTEQAIDLAPACDMRLVDVHFMKGKAEDPCTRNEVFVFAWRYIQTLVGYFRTHPTECAVIQKKIIQVIGIIKKLSLSSPASPFIANMLVPNTAQLVRANSDLPAFQDDSKLCSELESLRSLLMHTILNRDISAYATAPGKAPIISLHGWDKVLGGFDNVPKGSIHGSVPVDVPAGIGKRRALSLTQAPEGLARPRAGLRRSSVVELPSEQRETRDVSARYFPKMYATLPESTVIAVVDEIWLQIDPRVDRLFEMQNPDSVVCDEVTTSTMAGVMI